MQTHKMNTHACLSCGTIVDAATGVGQDDRPEEGDVTICIKCGHLMAFSSDLSFRELDEEEKKLLAKDETVLAIQKTLRISV